jgi:hypothetical protein
VIDLPGSISWIHEGDWQHGAVGARDRAERLDGYMVEPLYHGHPVARVSAIGSGRLMGHLFGLE